VASLILGKSLLGARLDIIGTVPASGIDQPRDDLAVNDFVLGDCSRLDRVLSDPRRNLIGVAVAVVVVFCTAGDLDSLLGEVDVDRPRTTAAAAVGGGGEAQFLYCCCCRFRSFCDSFGLIVIGIVADSVDAVGDTTAGSFYKLFSIN
jgi:hypothetical protein